MSQRTLDRIIVTVLAVIAIGMILGMVFGFFGGPIEGIG